MARCKPIRAQGKRTTVLPILCADPSVRIIVIVAYRNGETPKSVLYLQNLVSSIEGCLALSVNLMVATVVFYDCRYCLAEKTGYQSIKVLTLLAYTR